MKNGILIGVLALASLGEVSGQVRNFFIGTEDSYSILLDHRIATKHSKSSDGGFVDYYILREGGSLEFMLTISKVVVSSQDSSIIYTDGFKKSYLAECGCEIIDSRRRTFNNFSGVQFKIGSTLEGKPVNGFSVSVEDRGYLFNINFFALASRFKSLGAEYELMMNALVFRSLVGHIPE